MNSDDIRVIKKSTPYSGHFRMNHYRVQHRLFEGGWSDELSREVFDRGHAVAVILFDPVQDKLVLVEQFRIGAFAALNSDWFDADFSPWLIECVAGMIDEGEKPDDVARREVLEETGLEVRNLIPVNHYLVSPGSNSESVFLFCGQVEAPAESSIHGLKEEGEDIRLVVMPRNEAFTWLESGQITNSETIVAMQWFKLNHENIKKRWLKQDRSVLSSKDSRGP